MLLKTTPIFIWWNLWKNSCPGKYKGKATNMSMVKYAIYKDNYKMLSIAFFHIKWQAKWTDLIKKCEGCVHDTKVCLVAWRKSTDQGIKVKLMAVHWQIGVGWVMEIFWGIKMTNCWWTSQQLFVKEWKISLRLRIYFWSNLGIGARLQEHVIGTWFTSRCKLDKPKGRPSMEFHSSATQAAKSDQLDQKLQKHTLL